MGDFEPRMDKWGEQEISGLAADFKDAIVNKGRVKRDRKRAAKQAERRARWKRSWLGRVIAWLMVWVWRGIGLALLYVFYLFLRFWWEVFNMTERLFGA